MGLHVHVDNSVGGDGYQGRVLEILFVTRPCVSWTRHVSAVTWASSCIDDPGIDETFNSCPVLDHAQHVALACSAIQNNTTLLLHLSVLPMMFMTPTPAPAFKQQCPSAENGCAGAPAQWPNQLLSGRTTSTSPASAPAPTRCEWT
jgi:hypothetical protein